MILQKSFTLVKSMVNPPSIMFYAKQQKRLESVDLIFAEALPHDLAGIADNKERIRVNVRHHPFDRNGLKFFTTEGGLQGENITEILEDCDKPVDLNQTAKSCFKLDFMSEYEYVSTVCDFLEYLPPQTTIHRLAGNGLRTELVAPRWIGKKLDTLNRIDREFLRRDTRQGSKFKLV